MKIQKCARNDFEIDSAANSIMYLFKEAIISQDESRNADGIVTRDINFRGLEKRVRTVIKNLDITQ